MMPVWYHGLGYKVHLMRKNSLTLSAYVNGVFYRDYPKVLFEILDEFLERKFKRILYISTHTSLLL
jgi:hypothetical protein